MNIKQFVGGGKSCYSAPEICEWSFCVERGFNLSDEERDAQLIYGLGGDPWTDEY